MLEIEKEYKDSLLNLAFTLKAVVDIETAIGELQGLKRELDAVIPGLVSAKEEAKRLHNLVFFCHHGRFPDDR